MTSELATNARRRSVDLALALHIHRSRRPLTLRPNSRRRTSVAGERFQFIRRAETLRAAGPGLGDTYLAEDRHHRAYEAVKLYRPELGRNARHMIAAQRELADIAGIAHVDDGADGSTTWAARTWVDNSLLEFIDSGDLEPGMPAMNLLGNLAGVIESAAAEGYLHGRLHPGNVLLEDADDGETYAYVVDWLGAAAALPWTHFHPCVAPEVAAGGPHSPAADVYSLACLAWLVILGGLPSLEDIFAALERDRSHPERRLADVLTMRPERRPSVRTLVEEVASLVLNSRKELP